MKNINLIIIQRIVLLYTIHDTVRDTRSHTFRIVFTKCNLQNTSTCTI